jgi:hypothetical protein
MKILSGPVVTKHFVHEKYRKSMVSHMHKHTLSNWRCTKQRNILCGTKESKIKFPVAIFPLQNYFSSSSSFFLSSRVRQIPFMFQSLSYSFSYRFIILCCLQPYIFTDSVSMVFSFCPICSCLFRCIFVHKFLTHFSTVFSLFLFYWSVFSVKVL